MLGNEEPEVSVPGEIIVTGQEFYDYEAKYTEGGMELNAPASLPEDAVQSASYGPTAYTGDRRRGNGPGGLLLRAWHGQSAPQRDQHHPRFHPHQRLHQALGR